MTKLFVPSDDNKKKKLRNYFSVRYPMNARTPITDCDKLIRKHSNFEIFKNCAISQLTKIVYILNEYIHDHFPNSGISITKYNLNYNTSVKEEGISQLINLNFYEKFELNKNNIHDLSREAGSILYKNLYEAYCSSYKDHWSCGNYNYEDIINELSHLYQNLIFNLIIVLYKTSKLYII